MESTREGETIKVDIASENIEDLFEATGRKLNEGLHKFWWREWVATNASARETAKLELFALCINPDLIRKIEKLAQEIVQQWLKAYEVEILKLDESSRASYSEVRNLAANPELAPVSYPATIQCKAADDKWEKHLYVADDGLFHAGFNESERHVG